ncbi:MAG: hypothetical protein ACK5AC_16975, partial [Planctomycetota bacterium]
SRPFLLGSSRDQTRLLLKAARSQYTFWDRNISIAVPLAEKDSGRLPCEGRVADNPIAICRKWLARWSDTLLG